MLGGSAALFLAFFVISLRQKPTTHIVHAANEKLVSRNILPHERTSQSTILKEPNHGLPIRLEIPKIKVDANIEYMGLTATGDMDVPTNVKDAGWYKYGPHPGDKGNAVIAGHLDGTKGEPGVFIALTKLRPGDSLSIVDNKGQTTDFVVRETRTYNQTAHPSEVFNASDGAHLNLITCAGAWDITQHRFLNRLVVFADKSN